MQLGTQFRLHGRTSGCKVISQSQNSNSNKQTKKKFNKFLHFHHYVKRELTSAHRCAQRPAFRTAHELEKHVHFQSFWHFKTIIAPIQWLLLVLWIRERERERLNQNFNWLSRFLLVCSLKESFSLKLSQSSSNELNIIRKTPDQSWFCFLITIFLLFSLSSAGIPPFASLLNRPLAHSVERRPKCDRSPCRVNSS